MRREECAMIVKRAPGLLTTMLACALASAALHTALAQDAEEGSADEADSVAVTASEETIFAEKNALEIIKKGGFVMYPILLCSVLTVCFAFERLIVLRRGRVIPRPFVRRFVQQLRDGQLDRETALSLCEENGSPVARVFAGAVRKWGRPAVEVEQGFLDAGERVGTQLRRYLRMFHAVSTICPLLGLLGTVFGVIRSFDSIATAIEVDRSVKLAGGISEALVATAAGLFVAILALVCYWVFAGRADQLVIDIDSMGEELVQIISNDPTGESAQARAARARKRDLAAAKTAS
jgi:biopolymer transport protein ExbB